MRPDTKIKRCCRPVILSLIAFVLIILSLQHHMLVRAMFYRVILAITTVVGVHSLCDIPPCDWCLTPENSAKCRVTEQCSEWLANSPAHRQTVVPVDLAVYFEALCPDSTRFFREQLGPVFDQLSQTGIMNLTLIPYGNADEKQNSSGLWEFTCQHGPPECHGNILQTCAIHLKKPVSEHFPFVRCMMAKIEDGLNPDSAASACASLHGVDYDSLKRCAGGRLGNTLEHRMAVQTESLIPTQTYVPWVTVNGVHTEPMERLAESNLLKLICDSFKGEKPPVCPSRLSPTVASLHRL